jgi:hypothetical protein
MRIALEDAHRTGRCASHWKMRIALEDAHRTGRCASHWKMRIALALEAVYRARDSYCIGRWPLYWNMAVALQDGRYIGRWALGWKTGSLGTFDALVGARGFMARVGSVWPGLAVCGRQCMPSHPRACPTTNASKFSIFQFSIVLAMFQCNGHLPMQ